MLLLPASVPINVITRAKSRHRNNPMRRPLNQKRALEPKETLGIGKTSKEKELKLRK